ncbi:hypothetical protein [Klebsiella quasipneumoniae]|uniref:hypothetical protein n=1 Tax=Klebsiella quasipneumoniae TaxID=1463165 RepID=UPI00389018EE
MQNIGLGPFLLCHHFPQATDEAYAVRNGNAARRRDQRYASMGAAGLSTYPIPYRREQ